MTISTYIKTRPVATAVDVLTTDEGGDKVGIRPPRGTGPNLFIQVRAGLWLPRLDSNQQPSG